MGFFTRLFTGKSEGSIESTASGNIVKQILGIEILLIGLFLLLLVKSEVMRKMLLNNKIWLALFTFSVISIAWSDVQAVSFRRLIAFTTLLVCALAIAVNFRFKSLLIYLSDSIFVAALIGLLLIIVAPNMAIMDQDGAGRTNTFFGIFYDKNAGARCYAYALLIKIAYSNLADLKSWFKIAILAVCIVLANSATAIVMVVIGTSAIIALNVLHTSDQKVNLQRVLAVIVTAIFLSIIVNFAYTFLLELLGRDPSLTNRAIIWELITPYVEEKLLLGYGFGAFWASSSASAFVERWGFIGNAHSGYFEALLNGGLVYLVLVVAVILKAINDCLKYYVTKADGRIIAPVLAIIVIQVIVNYVGFVILNYNSADTFFLATICFALTYLGFQKKSD